MSIRIENELPLPRYFLLVFIMAASVAKVLPKLLQREPFSLIAVMAVAAAALMVTH